MKREFLGWIVAGAVVVLSCTLGAMQPQGQVGRYQLAQGRFPVIDFVGARQTFRDGFFRIDTQTGDVQEYFYAVGPDAPDPKWGTVVGHLRGP
jgi:hypothetical protein